mmetsp:Transcript_15504/g.13547  ORF Transcript_15504/g.13547 Transcript_15504/m.13547 type:complete len:101 (-) Transcript_15504:7-309(-)
MNRSAGGLKANDKSTDSEPVFSGRNEATSQKTTNDEDEGSLLKPQNDITPSMNILSPNNQTSLSSFSPEQKAIVKSVINKVLWEQKQKMMSESKDENISG